MTNPGRSVDPQGVAASAATVTGLLAASELRAGDVVAGRYRVERLLGMGGMGVVYLAHDQQLGIEVALKLLRPELASRPDAFERFRQELLLARQVSNPHVVRIHDLVRHGEAWLISMDYVAGQSLEQLLDERGTLSPDEALRITRQVASGLGAAHLRGVIHRDLKPANILIDRAGDAYISDFGVARSAGSTGITGSGVVIGTPEYLSPEQARAESVDGRSDLYAVGLMLYEMLSGTLPFRGGTPAEMLAQRIVASPQGIDRVRADLPPFVVRLVSYLLELRPARRCPSAEALVRAIDERRVPGLAPRTRRLLAALAVGLVLAGAGYAVERWRAAQPAAEVAIETRVDLAVLPFRAVGAEPDAALAAGIGRQLNAALLDGARGTLADPTRTARALSALGFDAEGAHSFIDRVADDLRARRLLEGELAREGSAWRISASLRDPATAEPAWTERVSAADDAAIAPALATLEQRLRDRLGAAPRTTPWPEPATLRLVGSHVPALDGAVPDDAVATSDAASLPAWWSLRLEGLDRSARSADAATAAAQAEAAVAGDDSHAARRLRAYAQLLRGEPVALAALRELALQAPADFALATLVARAQADDGDLAAATATLEAVVAADPQALDAWYLLGKFAIMQGDARRAADQYLVRAQVLANQLRDRRLQADVVNALGLAYRHLGLMDEAVDQFDKAVKLRRALADVRGEAGSLRNLATVQAMLGRFDAAEAALAQARPLTESLGDTAALAGLANDVGLLAEERGDFRRALEAYREALVLRQALDDPRLTGESLLNVGFAYFQVGEFDNAQVYWQQATAEYARIDDRAGAVAAEQGLGLAHTARGDLVVARAALDRSLADAESLQMVEERAVSLSGLAELDRLEGRIGSALARNEAAAGLFDQLEDLRGQVEMRILRSAILADVGDWDGADAALGELAVDQLSNREQASLVAVRRGEIALGRGQAAPALAHADAAIAAAGEGHSYAAGLAARLLRARALAALARASEARGEIQRARTELARYASVPLRLALAEAALQVAPATAAPDYREAGAQLARLPGFGRAYVLHALAAATDPGAAAAARTAWAALRLETPPPQQAALDARAAALGIATPAAP